MTSLSASDIHNISLSAEIPKETKIGNPVNLKITVKNSGTESVYLTQTRGITYLGLFVNNDLGEPTKLTPKGVNEVNLDKNRILHSRTSQEIAGGGQSEFKIDLNDYYSFVQNNYSARITLQFNEPAMAFDVDLKDIKFRIVP